MLRGFEAAPEGIFAKSRELTTQTAEMAKFISTGITYLGILDMPEGADDLFEDITIDSLSAYRSCKLRHTAMK